ncbi:MAG: hypothetical protein EPN30_06000 [Actinomycetota bacterium]|nr:MAG: hypothetical protein EPN30_06000 [Actinomycetota bacterium]
MNRWVASAPRNFAKLHRWLNGSQKDACHEALSQPGSRKVRGIASQSIFVAVLLRVANVRKIEIFRNGQVGRENANVVSAKKQLLVPTLARYLVRTPAANIRDVKIGYF